MCEEQVVSRSYTFRGNLKAKSPVIVHDIMRYHAIRYIGYRISHRYYRTFNSTYRLLYPTDFFLDIHHHTSYSQGTAQATSQFFLSSSHFPPDQSLMPFPLFEYRLQRVDLTSQRCRSRSHLPPLGLHAQCPSSKLPVDTPQPLSTWLPEDFVFPNTATERRRPKVKREATPTNLW